MSRITVSRNKKKKKKRGKREERKEGRKRGKESLRDVDPLPRDEVKIVNGAFSISYGYYVRDEAPAISLPFASRIDRPVLLGNVSRHRSREHSLLSFRYDVPCNNPECFFPFFIGNSFLRSFSNRSQD